jgi:hypothetical protein
MAAGRASNKTLKLFVSVSSPLRACAKRGHWFDFNCGIRDQTRPSNLKWDGKLDGTSMGLGSWGELPRVTDSEIHPVHSEDVHAEGNLAGV